MKSPLEDLIPKLETAGKERVAVWLKPQPDPAKKTSPFVGNPFSQAVWCAMLNGQSEDRLADDTRNARGKRCAPMGPG